MIVTSDNKRRRVSRFFAIYQQIRMGKVLHPETGRNRQTDRHRETDTETQRKIETDRTRKLD